MKSIGIDIGSYSVKVAEIQSSGKSFQLLSLYSFPLLKTNQSDQEIEIIEQLRNYLGNRSLDQVRFNVALRQDRVSVRKKTFPFTDRRKILKSLAFELEDELPFNSDTAIYDAQIINTRGLLADVLTFAAPKHHIANLLRLMNDVGISPHLISSEGSALANLFQRWQESPIALVAEQETSPQFSKNIQLVLNIGHQRSTLCAFDHGMLVGIRTILWGGKNLADALVKKYSLPYSEAIKELKTKAFILPNRAEASYDAKIFSDLMGSNVKDLSRDLQLAILETKGDLGGEISTLQLTGGVSGMQGLAPFLTQNLNIPVNCLQILDLVPANSNIERSDEFQASMGTAIGLAIDGLRKFNNPALNFRKEEFAPQSNQLIEFWSSWGNLAKIGAGAVIAFAIWTNLRIDFAQKLTDDASNALRGHAKTVAHLPSKLANEANVKKFIKENRKKVAEIKTLQSLAGMKSAMEILKKISDAAPAKNSLTLDVRNLAIEDSHVAIEGYLTKQSDLSILQQALTNLSVDGKVASLSSQLPAVAGKISFSLSFNADRNIKSGGIE